MRYAVSNQSESGTFQVWRGVLAGASASLVGIGLARFAYTPLLPAIIGAHWFPASTAAYLGAANLGGYLAGALAAGWLARRAQAAAVLRAMMILATIAFVACAFPVSFLWFFAWRFLSGISGGALMVLAAPTIIAHVAPSRRGFASGAIFAGIGLGIAASGTIVPLLLRHGLTETWLGLATVSLLLTMVAWHGWPSDEAPAQDHAHGHTHAKAPSPPALRALFAEYALNAVGLVPHMIFLVDFVARGLGKGVDAGAQFWVLYGLGAIAGPLLAGHLADRAGFGPALRVAYLVQLVAVALPAVSSSAVLLMVSSVVVGAFTPGIVPLVLGRVNELLAHHPAAQKGAWRTATTGFAVLQALAAYGLSFLFSNSGGDYRLLFAIGAAALAVALTVDLFAALRSRAN
ncbi:MFS transporter (plasmid) [Burkholderia sp. SFA1]|uniref:YbfB/YjiJ family MFS transporter n=1 Tax=unclassified Caballeronia TaxID=2646786 RepID=UPI001F23D095|nr:MULTISPECIES: YbfB/YjiJ family MFS transporter [unclassified Caballeronia]MCE4547064.1 MFS transporter [Caballeronia sp. PC1]MCE4572463.1 MFS transporter [Caballeronia sp. CLC5]BBQ02170.1 MFS transporter [Burkholderia sp. SFA1]